MQQFEAQEIGARIALARKRAGGMTQETLADLIGVSTRSVQDYEAGVTIPWKYLLPIAKVTKVDVDWLIHGDETEPPEVRELLEDIDARMRRIEEHVLGQEAAPDRQANP